MKYDSCGPDIRFVVIWLTGRHLRRQIVNSPQKFRRIKLLLSPRTPKITQLDIPIKYQEILRLDILMGDALPMQKLHRPQQPPHILPRLPLPQPPPLQHPPQRHLSILQNQLQLSILTVEMVQADDVGVLQAEVDFDLFGQLIFVF